MCSCTGRQYYKVTIQTDLYIQCNPNQTVKFDKLVVKFIQNCQGPTKYEYSKYIKNNYESTEK